MKAVVCLFSLLACCALSAPAGEKDKLKCDMDYLDKTFGIKYKSHKLDTIKQKLVLLLEFTKDVEDVKELRADFAAYLPMAGVKLPPIRLWFMYFDEDNVSLGKTPLERIEGELSGKKGDAFRVVLQFSQPWAMKTRKVEARAGEKVKTEEKKKE